MKSDAPKVIPNRFKKKVYIYNSDWRWKREKRDSFNEFPFAIWWLWAGFPFLHVGLLPAPGGRDRDRRCLRCRGECIHFLCISYPLSSKRKMCPDRRQPSAEASNVLAPDSTWVPRCAWDAAPLWLLVAPLDCPALRRRRWNFNYSSKMINELVAANFCFCLLSWPPALSPPKPKAIMKTAH